MYKYLLKHEKYINETLESKDKINWQELKNYQKVQIEFMQHERLIHLIVTLAFSFFLIISLIATVLSKEAALGLLDLILVIILIFYILHYYRLENGVQRWYLLYNKIYEKYKNN